MVTMQDKLKNIEKIRKRLLAGGGNAAIKKQHDLGKLTARERVEKLLDPGTFQEVDLWQHNFRSGFACDEKELPGDGVIVGSGEVNGRLTYVWAQDATCDGGRMADLHVRKIVAIMERALRNRAPIVGMYDSEGIRVSNALNWHAHFTLGMMAKFQTLSSGVIPQVSLVMGPCVGGAALSANLADCVFMVKGTSYMHVATPSKDIDSQELGSAQMHYDNSGCCHVLAENDEDCLQKCRELLKYLPQSNKEKLPVIETSDPWDRADSDFSDLVPMSSFEPFDMREVIKRMVDDGNYVELQGGYAKNLTIGLCSLGGWVAGIISSNSMYEAGCFDVNSADKFARFTRFCDAFGIPIVYLTDSPAFKPSIDEETRGVLRHGTMTINAVGEATVPKITMYVRKCFGGANLILPSSHMQGDRWVAWPSVDRGAMGASEMVSYLFKNYMAAASTPEEAEERRAASIKRMEKTIEDFTWRENEEFIDSRETRSFLVRTIKSLANKEVDRPWRKHETMNL